MYANIFRIEFIMKTISILTLILFILIWQSASAKKTIKNGVPVVSQWEFGLTSGTSLFLTSINPDQNAVNKKINYWRNELNPAVGLFVVRNISPSLGFELGWLYTRLTGKWNNKWPPLAVSTGRPSPLRYDSEINQFDLMMVFNLNQMMLPGDEEDNGHLFFKTGIGLSQIHDNNKFYSVSNHARISFALGVGYSLSLNKKLKLQIGSTFRSVVSDNLDGVHVVGNDTNGKLVNFMKIYEIYNYSYLSMSYNLGKLGSKKYRSTYYKKRF